MKKSITLICVVMMVLSLAGCSGSNSENKPSDTAAVKSGTESTVNQFADKMTYTYAGVGLPTDGEMAGDELYQFISRKFNVEFKLKSFDWDSWAEQLNVMMASGEMSDIVDWDFIQIDMEQYNQYAGAGMLKPIPDFNGKYPALQAARDKLKVLPYLNIDGKLYAWSKLRNDNIWNMDDTWEFVYRKDWAEKLGMARDEYTVDEFEALAKAFVDKDPGGNGPGNTIGLVETTWIFPSVMDLYDQNAYTFEKKDGKYVWGSTLPTALDGVKFTRKLYDEGVLWKDFYTEKDTDIWPIYLAGKAGIYADNFGLGAIDSDRKEFKKEYPDIDENKAVSIMKVKGIDGRFPVREIDNWWSLSVYSSSMSDEKMDRLLSLMDWLAGDEGSKYCQYGVEGKDWTLTDGKVNLNWSKDESGKMVAPDHKASVLRGLAVLNGDFEWSSPSIPQETKDEYSSWFKYRIDHPELVNRVPMDYAMEYFVGPRLNKYGNILTDWKIGVMQIVVGSQNVEADWNAFVSEMRKKIDPVVEELNASPAK